MGGGDHALRRLCHMHCTPDIAFYVELNGGSGAWMHIDGISWAGDARDGVRSGAENAVPARTVLWGAASPHV
jgi:hypothetical protein